MNLLADVGSLVRPTAQYQAKTVPTKSFHNWVKAFTKAFLKLRLAKVLVFIHLEENVLMIFKATSKLLSAFAPAF